MITYKDWEKLTLELGGQLWESGNKLPDKPIVFSTAEHIDNLFRDILETNYSNKFILVSAASDAGPIYQKDNPPYGDVRKWANMDESINPSLGYHDFILRSRHNKERCLKRDKFALKMYSWTSSTFPCIPPNIVNWFTTNCQISEDRVTPIPFGINPDSYGPINNLLERYESGWPKRTDKVVARWSNSTNERYHIKNSLDINIFLTNSVSQEDFLYSLATSKYCLCPEGNGLDSYRILEALYLGCLPIIITNLEKPIWHSAYNGLPCIRPSEIHSVVYDLIRGNAPLQLTGYFNHIKLDFWKGLFEKCLKTFT